MSSASAPPPPRRFPRAAAVALIVAVLAAASVALWWWIGARSPAPNSLVLYGNVDIREVQPAFNDNGPVAQVLAQEGASVKKGELIATLDDTRYRAALEQAEAQMRNQEQVLARLVAGSRPEEIAQAKATMDALRATADNDATNYHRAEMMARSGAGTRQQRDNAKAAFDAATQQYEAARQAYRLALAGPRVEDIAAARAAYQAAQAAVALARREQADTRLYAPSDGVVENRILEPGDMASPTTPVYTIALPSPLWVRAYVGGNRHRQDRPRPAGRHHDRQLSRPSLSGLDRLHLADRRIHPEDRRDPGTAYRAGLSGPGLCVRRARRIAPRHAGDRADRAVAESRSPPPAASPFMTKADPAPALSLEDVARSFRVGRRTVTALDGISAAAARGTVTGLIGPDGAGKTTLMRLVAGLLRADRGRIAVLGVDVARDPLAVQAMLGYMPQHFGLYEDLTVRENLDLYADLQGVPPADRAGRYGELLHMTGLRPFTARLAGRLSGGMKQKLGLACTLVRAPEMLLLDEPTVGVDPVSRRELWEIIDHLTRAAGTTVLFSTAYLDEADRCSTVLLLHEGRLIAAGDPRDLTARMTGRSFHASAAGLTRRQLQERLAVLPGVLDATIEGGHVRLVTDEGAAPPAELPGIGPVATLPTPPRFEDSFVALLRARMPPRPAAVAPPPPAPGPPIEGYEEIAVHHLTRRFGSFRAVDDISFSVRQGEIFGLLGANGAGKSTTFRMLCGLLPPSDGTLRVAGFDLRRAAAAARGRIGYMAQKFSLYGNLSVRDNLNFFSSAYKLHGARQRQRIEWAMVELELGPVAAATSGDLPLGFKQRLALACALMHEPDILFLDEPTSGVDPLARREFWRRINALAEAGVTILVTTHFMEEAEYCDRLVIMAQGRILAEGTAEDMKARLRRPNNPDPTMEDAFVALIEGAAAGAASPANAA